MFKYKLNIVLISLLVITGRVQLFGQNKLIDSLKLALNNAGHDTVRCYLLYQLAEKAGDTEWPLFNEKLIALTESKIKTTNPANLEYNVYKKYSANALNNIGYAWLVKNDTKKAREYFVKSLEIQEGNRLPDGQIYYKKGIANSLNNIGACYKDEGNLHKTLEYLEKSRKIYEEIGDSGNIAYSFNNIAYILKSLGQISKALDYYHKSLKIQENIIMPDGQTGNLKGIALTVANIARIYKNQGNIPKALDYYRRSLKIYEMIDDKGNVTASLDGIAAIYLDQGEVQRALEYYSQSRRINEEKILPGGQIGDKKGIANSLINSGSVYLKLVDNEKLKPTGIRIDSLMALALPYFNKSLQISGEIGHKQAHATSLSHLGLAYMNLADNLFAGGLTKAGSRRKYDSLINTALDFYKKSVSEIKEIGNKVDYATALHNIATIYHKLAAAGGENEKNKYAAAALELAAKSLQMGKELAYPESIRNSSQLLYKIYSSGGNHKLALANYELYIQMRDSINNESTRKAAIKSQLKYDYEKQAAADSVAHAKESEIKNAEIAKQTAEIKAKRNQQYALFGGLGLVMIFAVFMFNRFKITQKQKEIIESQKTIVEKQKHLVEEKQKEILDSIHYAQRIQKAHLPTEKYFERHFNNLKKS